MDVERGAPGGANPPPEPREAAAAFAAGSISSRDAMMALGLRDYAGLLVLLGDFGLEPPRPNDMAVEEQTETFERSWNALQP